MANNIGFIQGRLSPIVNNKIQAFPWDHWRQEFPLAQELGLNIIEWTLDQDRLYENPLMDLDLQKEIKAILKKYNFSIPSLTGDCFMQAPFYKLGQNRLELLRDFENIVKACGALGVEYIVFPLVDNGALKTIDEESDLVDELTNRESLLLDNKVKIVFESDFSPNRLLSFIAKFPRESFGINYDTGNSASLGFNSQEELDYYGDRVLNIHIKDRLLNGGTVPLGEGDVNFSQVFEWIKNYGYTGNLILQTARCQNGKHVNALRRYIEFVKKRLS